MSGRLAGRVALVTGAARGTGAAIAERFVEEDARVVIGDVREDEGRAVAERLGDGARFELLDVRDPASWDRCLAETAEHFATPTILVNNAAVLDVTPIGELDWAKARDLVDVNLIGPMIGTQAVLPGMREAGGGSIVNLGSIDAMEGMGWVSPYCASKWGLRGFTKAAALELGQHGIRVNLVCPHGGSAELSAGFRENMMRRIESGEKIKVRGIEGGILGERHAQPRDIANVVLFLASDEAAFCHGAEYMVDGGHTAGHIWFQTG